MNPRLLQTKKSLNTSVCEMELKDDNIVFIRTFEDASIEIPEIDDINKALKELVSSQPCYLVVIAGAGSSSSNEAREYGAKMREKNVTAEAIVINNIAIRILANFYIKVNKPQQKIKLFSNTHDAVEWLYTIIEGK